MVTGKSNMRPNDYQEHWRRYNKLQNQFFFLLIGWVLLGYVSGFLVVSYGSHVPLIVWVLICGPMAIVALVRVAHFPCPRCGRCFLGTRGYGPSYAARECFYCGLPKLAAYDAGAGLALFCSKCGTAVPSGFCLFCPQCGAAVAASRGPVPGSTADGGTRPE